MGQNKLTIPRRKAAGKFFVTWMAFIGPCCFQAKLGRRKLTLEPNMPIDTSTDWTSSHATWEPTTANDLTKVAILAAPISGASSVYDYFLDLGFSLSIFATVEGLLNNLSPDAAAVIVLSQQTTSLHELRNQIQERAANAKLFANTLTADSDGYLSQGATIEAIEQVVTQLVDPIGIEQIRQLDLSLQLTVPKPPQPNSIVAASRGMLQILAQTHLLAKSDFTVLITGESGSGKSLIAKQIHTLSERRQKPFVAINCSALPAELIESELFGHTKGAFTGATNERRGRIEAAEGGTLFLDEIGDLPLMLQPKLLTFLQDQTFQRIGSDRTHQANVRIIAATNQDLLGRCQEQKFREDLFFRLSVLRLSMPPLRERKEELEALTIAILNKFSEKNGTAAKRVSVMTLRKLQSHNWPGNIRELENVLARATVFCDIDEIQPEHIDFDHVRQASATSEGSSDAGSLAGQSLDDIERRAIQETLTMCLGNKAKAARILGISERSIYNKIERYGFDF